MKKVNFNGVECVLMKSKYQVNDSLALVLLNSETGEMHLTVTVYVDGFPNMGETVAVVKTYSENEGVLQALGEAGVIVSIVAEVPVGYTVCPVVQFDLTDVEELV